MKRASPARSPPVTSTRAMLAAVSRQRRPAHHRGRLGGIAQLAHDRLAAAALGAPSRMDTRGGTRPPDLMLFLSACAIRAARLERAAAQRRVAASRRSTRTRTRPLIQLLRITAAEQRQLRTIIGADERRRRNAERHQRARQAAGAEPGDVSPRDVVRSAWKGPEAGHDGDDAARDRCRARRRQRVLGRRACEGCSKSVPISGEAPSSA
jgi:hypothetical protein